MPGAVAVAAPQGRVLAVRSQLAAGWLGGVAVSHTFRPRRAPQRGDALQVFRLSPCTSVSRAILRLKAFCDAELPSEVFLEYSQF